MTDKGARLGQKLAEVFADTSLKVRAASAGPEAAVKQAAIEALMERWEQNLAGRNRQLLESLLPDGDLPDEVAAHLDRITRPEHQIDLLVGIGAAVLSVFSIAGAVVQGGIDELVTQSRELQPHIPLSPEAAAKAVVNSIWDQGQGEREALKSGVDPHRFETLTFITGQPLAPQILMEAYRRGIIDEERMHQGLLQGDVRNEWFDVMVALRHNTASAAAAIEAAVQNHLPEDVARRKAEEDGLDPDNWPWMYALAGNPPGNEHMVDLLHRGVMSRDEVEQGMRESRLKNKYIAAMIEGGYREIPQEQVRMLLRRGVIDQRTAVDKLMRLGFRQQDAATLAALASADKTEPERNLARTQIVDGYMDRLYDRPRAAAMLDDLGYDPAEAGLLLDLADHARQRRYTDSAVQRFHTMFVRRKIDRPAASVALDTLGVPSGQRDELLKLWDLERQADVPNLTAAQWGGLLRRGVIDETRHKAEVMKLGYDEEEAGFLAALAFPAG